MAIPGKFETTRVIHCMQCRRKLNLRARSLDWTGDLRTELVCTTPDCGNVFERVGPNRATKGNVSSRPPVELVTLPDGNKVALEEYECSEAEAMHFCDLFRGVLQQIPSAASGTILAHWQKGRGSPHVWLLNDRREWGGRGWAACRTEGLSMCVVATLISQIPDEFIRTAIAHELGHTLFIAGREPNHVQPAITLEPISDPVPADPLRKVRPEWLVWRLMEAWGFDQPAMEEWMERNIRDDADGIRVREHPQGDADFEGKCIADRTRCEELLKDLVFPVEFEMYRRR